MLYLRVVLLVAACLGVGVKGDDRDSFLEEKLSQQLQGRALHAIDGLIQSLSGKADSVLGAAFRDEDGNLLEASFAPDRNLQDAGPVLCPGGTASATVSSKIGSTPDVSLTYNYSPSDVKSLSSSATKLSACVYLSVVLPPQGINTDDGVKAKTASFPFSGADWLTCNNCFASLGGTLTLQLTCGASLEIGTTSTEVGDATCQLNMVFGGASAMKAELIAKDPKLTATIGPVNLLSLVPPVLVFKDQTSLFNIYVVPQLMVTSAAPVFAVAFPLNLLLTNTSPRPALFHTCPPTGDSGRVPRGNGIGHAHGGLRGQDVSHHRGHHRTRRGQKQRDH